MKEPKRSKQRMTDWRMHSLIMYADDKGRPVVRMVAKTAGATCGPSSDSCINASWRWLRTLRL